MSRAMQGNLQMSKTTNAKKRYKTLEQLKRHEPSVVPSELPTKIIFANKNHIVCGLSLEEFRRIFVEFDEECAIYVFSQKSNYSFVEFSELAKASHALESLNGAILSNRESSPSACTMLYVNNLPSPSPMNSVQQPNDLKLIDSFVTETEEQNLVNVLNTFGSSSKMKNRSVVHFKHEFDYSTNSAFKESPDCPEVVERLIDRVCAAGVCSFRPDQVTVNIYRPGNGIPPHYDKHSAFEDPIISLSLLSDVVMEFKDGSNSARVAPVILPRRSLCLIQGESRFRWKHGITSTKYDIHPLSGLILPRQPRISITLRKIRHEPCQCAWKEYCDWDRGGEMSIPKDDSAAARLEAAYVADVYENIAGHFDKTRHQTQWRAVDTFLQELPEYSVLYDIGCGNGKYLVRKDTLLKFGCDLSFNLCKIAQAKNCFVARADGLAVPFRREADAVICVAVLHHFASHSRRLAMVRELLALLRIGGRGCITVWSMDQSGSQYSKMRRNKDYISKDYDPSKILVHDGRDFIQQDVFAPWQVKNDKGEDQTFLRFYHVFREGELEELLQEAGSVRVFDVVAEQGNWIASFEKLA